MELFCEITQLKMVILVAAVNIVFMALVVLVTLLGLHGSSIRLLVVGVLCVVLTIGMYAAPMVAMVRIMKL